MWPATGARVPRPVLRTGPCEPTRLAPPKGVLDRATALPQPSLRGDLIMPMQAILWDESMSTGVERLDSQHKQLIAWLNDLLVAMSEGRGRAEIDGLLRQLGGYAALHFGNEEECFEQWRCPMAAQNAAAHKEFIATFQNLRDEYDQTGPTSQLAVRVQGELLRWLTAHIKRTDTSLKPCVREP